MSAHTVRKETTIYGKTYHPGDEVPVERIARENPELVRKMLDQRRLVPVEVTVSRKGRADG